MNLTVILQWIISSFSPVTLNWQLSSSGFQSIILNRSWFGSKIDSRNFNSAFSPDTDIFHSSHQQPGRGGKGRTDTASAQLILGSECVCARSGGWRRGTTKRGWGEAHWRQGETSKQRPPRNNVRGARQRVEGVIRINMGGWWFCFILTWMTCFSGQPSWFNNNNKLKICIIYFFIFQDLNRNQD